MLCVPMQWQNGIQKTPNEKEGRPSMVGPQGVPEKVLRARVEVGDDENQSE